MNEERIAAATADCISTCEKSNEWLVCISDYMMRLRNVYGWSQAMAEEVGRRALHYLQTHSRKNASGY
jgi:hypothetical protein